MKSYAKWLKLFGFSIVLLQGLLTAPEPARALPLRDGPTMASPFRLAQAATTQPSPAPPPVQVLPFDDALVSAAMTLLSQIPATDLDPSTKRLMVVDPLIDGMTGYQSTATKTMEALIRELVRYKYPHISIQPFSASNVRRAPLVLVGTFTTVNAQGQTVGAREAWRICLVLADLNSGKVVAKGTARALMQGVDITPSPHFRDSPAWTSDSFTDSYISTCQASKVGDAIQTSYLDGVIAATEIAEAIDAYDAGHYREALEHYYRASDLPAGKQLRVYTGLYLTNQKLGRPAASAEAFGKIIEHGLTSKRLAVKFFFKPGSTAFVPDKQISGPYSMWLKEIAKQATESNACMEIVGHTSPTGPEPLNQRLSQLRAEYIQQRLVAESAALNRRMIANGVGSRETMVGNGRDDMSDAIDRRVAFNVIACQ